MDWHVGADIHEFVASDGSSSGNIGIARTFRIIPCLCPSHSRLNKDVYVWHHTLYCICNDDLETYIHVPLWHIISEWTIECFPELLWVELRHVGIYNQDNETGVEELSYEGSLND